MKFQNARQRLDDTTFLIGAFRRRAALKELRESPDPDAAESLVDAIDQKSPSAKAAKGALAAKYDPAWTDRLWEIWAKRRQPWLGSQLEEGGVAHTLAGATVGLLSRLKLGGNELTPDADTMALVATLWADKDSGVQNGARAFAGRLKQRSVSTWLAAMLELKEFDLIGKDRAALESVVPMLREGNSKAQAGARAFCEQFVPYELGILAKLLLKQGSDLPIERDVALSVAGYLKDANPSVAFQANEYASRVLVAKPDFALAFALKCGREEQLAANRGTTLQALTLLRDGDAALAPSVRAWITNLPNDQQLNDVIVDDWLRSDDPFLTDLLRKQRRLPSDGGKETLLRLLFSDAKGYAGLDDTDGRLLAEALAMSNEERRKRIVQTIQDSRQSALADQLRRASLQVQGMDANFALRALEASGDEDRMVDAARDMNGRELFDLCRRWMDTGRRPADPKKRNAVDRAVAALKDQPKLVVEPAEPLPAGLVSIFDVWNRTKLSDDQLRSELQAPDALVRARALFLGAKRGAVGEDVLRAKAGSEDWPERFAAALNGLHPTAANDHVYWITACAGQDAGAQQAAVRCGVDEFERAETELAELRKKATPWASRMAGELEALQAFRMVFAEGEITILKDDSATVKGAVEKGGDATRKDIDDAFGGGKKRKK